MLGAKTLSGFPTWVVGAQTLDHLLLYFPGELAVLEVEQAGHELAPIRDANIVGSGLTHYATALLLKQGFYHIFLSSKDNKLTLIIIRSFYNSIVKQ